MCGVPLIEFYKLLHVQCIRLDNKLNGSYQASCKNNVGLLNAYVLYLIEKHRNFYGHEK